MVRPPTARPSVQCEKSHILASVGLYWTFMLCSIDSCQNRVSADQYHMTLSRAQVSTHRGYLFFFFLLRWLNTVLRAVSGNSRDGACFQLDKQTWRRKKQWYTEDDFSKSTYQNFVIFGRILTFIGF